MKKRHFMIWWGILFLLLTFCIPNADAQSEGRLQLVSIDTSDFPVVKITLITRDANSAPLRNVSDIVLRENGLPIADFTFGTIPNGVDVTFVIDANQGFLAMDDESGLSRQDKIRESIIRYADEFMNQEGLDTVSIVVPAERQQIGEFLLQGESDSADVIAAVNEYAPVWPGPTPLNDMLDLALDNAQANAGNGRYQAILLFSDSRRLDEQLSFPLLTAKANDTRTPIYVAILGASADPDEVGNAQQLFEPTRASYYHLADPMATDPLYDIWRQQSNPTQVIYRSQQQQSGRNQVTLNLGSELASASFEIQLEAPEVALLFDEEIIRRVGARYDAPLAELQPNTKELPLVISWPDGRARQIEEIQILVNGSPQMVVGEFQPDASGSLTIPWDISDQGSGDLDLAVQVIDEIGLRGSSDPVTTAVQVDLPQPPTPVITPTAEPQTTVIESAQEDLQSWIASAQTRILAAPTWIRPAAAMVLLMLLAIALWLFIKSRRSKAVIDADLSDQALSGEEQEKAPGFTFVEYVELVPLQKEAGDVIRLEGDNLTVGSQAENVDILIDDGSINRFHARIRCEDRTWWLFDEGSADGTYLNYERLGLAPREMKDGDVLQFGQVRYQFRIRQVINNNEE